MFEWSGASALPKQFAKTVFHQGHPPRGGSPIATSLNQLLSLALLAGLAGCRHADPAPAPTDPLLGHWRSDTERLVRYQPNGQISQDTTVAHRQELDFTATTYTKVDYAPTGLNAPVPARGSGTYTRTGEAIGFGGPGNYTPVPALLYVRGLTPTSFTLETVPVPYGIPSSWGGTSFVAFHR